MEWKMDENFPCEGIIQFKMTYSIRLCNENNSVASFRGVTVQITWGKGVKCQCDGVEKASKCCETFVRLIDLLTYYVYLVVAPCPLHKIMLLSLLPSSFIIYTEQQQIPWHEWISTVSKLKHH